MVCVERLVGQREVEVPRHWDKLLLAGTRVTGERPHLGTFYGWLDQLNRAQEELQVCVLIADLQSLDVTMEAGRYIHDAALELAANFRLLLSPQIPVLIESRIPYCAPLGVAVAAYVSSGVFRRVGPLRKLAREGNLTANAVLYPSLMVADILATGATHMLSKPEGTFQHVDIINDIIHRLREHVGIPEYRIGTWQKRRVNIPSLDGSGPMKRARARNGCVDVVYTNRRKLVDQLRRAVRPEQRIANRGDECNVIRSVWSAVEASDGPRVPMWCREGDSGCLKCIRCLATAIEVDLRRYGSEGGSAGPSHGAGEEDLYRYCSERSAGMLRRIHDASRANDVVNLLGSLAGGGRGSGPAVA